MKIKALLVVAIVAVTASPLPVPAQDGKQPASPAPGSLEDLLAKGLKQNPDVLVAEAKVREAEAELNRVRQMVLTKIAVLHADIDFAKAQVEQSSKQLKRLSELRAGGQASAEEFDLATVILLKHKSELARLQADMALLVGKKVAGLNLTVKELAFSPDGRLLVEKDEHGKVRIWDVKTGKQIEGKVADLKAPTIHNVRTALETPIRVEFKQVPLGDVLEYLQKHVKGVNLLSGVKGEVQPVNAVLTEPVTLAALLQLVEDQAGVRFVVREYGIVAVDRDAVPPGAVPVSDFLKQAEVEGKK
jgi:hypothetical protein